MGLPLKCSGHAGVCFPGVFSESVAATDPAPCGVAEFPSAAARLVAFPEPHYILFTADPDAQTGAERTCMGNTQHGCICAWRIVDACTQVIEPRVARHMRTGTVHMPLQCLQKLKPAAWCVSLRRRALVPGLRPVPGGRLRACR